MTLEWTRFRMYEDDPSDSGTWISGIYKVRSYSEGRFYAYYMRDGDKNWGWNVSTPPMGDFLTRFWPTLESSQMACENHAKGYTPANRTVTRAKEISGSFFPLAD